MCVILFTSCLPAERVAGESTETPAMECCACGTAKYRLTFYGNWSEKVHPKDYPSEFKLWPCMHTVQEIILSLALANKSSKPPSRLINPSQQVNHTEKNAFYPEGSMIFRLTFKTYSMSRICANICSSSKVHVNQNILNCANMDLIIIYPQTISYSPKMCDLLIIDI